MVESLVKDTFKMNKEDFNRIIEKEKLITQEKKQDESLSIANEIAEVIKEEYQQSFNKIKDKLLSSLKENSNHKLRSSVTNQQPLKEQKVSKNSDRVKEVKLTQDHSDQEDKKRSKSAYNSRSSKRKNQIDKENVNKDSESENVHCIDKLNQSIINSTEQKESIKKANENILDKEAFKLFQAFKGYITEGTKENPRMESVKYFIINILLLKGTTNS